MNQQLPAFIIGSLLTQLFPACYNLAVGGLENADDINII
jgi:hypothetical protein